MNEKRPRATPQRLWLWKNFVDGRPEYWAFDNPYPTHGGGDPMTLGEPCGYAIFKESTVAPGRVNVPEEEVIAAIKRASVRSETRLINEVIRRTVEYIANDLKARDYLGPGFDWAMHIEGIHANGELNEALGYPLENAAPQVPGSASDGYRVENAATSDHLTSKPAVAAPNDAFIDECIDHPAAALELARTRSAERLTTTPDEGPHDDSGRMDADADLARLVESGRQYRLRVAKSPDERLNIALSANELARIGFALQQLSLRSASAFAMPTEDEISAYRNLFLAELDKNMNNSSASPSTDAHRVALHAFVKQRNSPDSRVDRD